MTTTSSINSLVRGLQKGNIVLVSTLSPEILLGKHVYPRFLCKTVSCVESGPANLKLLLQSKSWSGRHHIVIIERYPWDMALVTLLKKKSPKVAVLIIYDGEYHNLRPVLERVADISLRIGRGPSNMFTHIGNHDLEKAREAGDDSLLLRLVQAAATNDVDLDRCSDVDVLFTKVPSEVAMSLLPLSAMDNRRQPSKKKQDWQTTKTRNEHLLDHVIVWFSTSSSSLLNRKEALDRLVYEYQICDQKSIPFVCSDDKQINDQLRRLAGRLCTM